MPEMDGFEMARRIHEDTDLSGVVVMMLSSCDLSSDALRCRELGISRYLVKPVMQADLLDAILVTLGIAAAQPEAQSVARGSAAPSGGEVLAGRRVLVAEDHPVNRKLITKMLEKWLLIPVLVTNGTEVLRALESDTFDLILMDVQMPVLDGLEATRLIRKNPRWNGLPIVAMTAHAMSGDMERCLAAGMNGYISKPVHPSQLLETVDGYLHRTLVH
jgi:CheY-like chemotaxis protein